MSDEAAFRREIADLRREVEGTKDEAPRRVERQGATLTTLVDRWDEMPPRSAAAPAQEPPR